MSRAAEAVLCITFYCINQTGSRSPFRKGMASRSSGLGEPLAKYEYSDKNPSLQFNFTVLLTGW